MMSDRSANERNADKACASVNVSVRVSVDTSDSGLRHNLIREIVRADFQLDHPDVVAALRAFVSGSTEEACSHLWRDVLRDIVGAIEDDDVELELFIRTVSLLGLISSGSRPQLLQRFA